MRKTITPPALRVKVTGICNRTCSFCHEEGDMRHIETVEPDQEFFGCIKTLSDSMGIERVMLTGGEPLIHPHLEDIVRGIEIQEMSLTTNGIRLLSQDEWRTLKSCGLKKVIVSMHNASVQSFLQLEIRQRSFGWASHALDAQKKNLMNAASVGLHVRVNIVAYESAEETIRVLSMLEDIQLSHKIEVRLLNDLSNLKRSQRNIRHVCDTLQAEEISESRRAGSSNATSIWKTESGFMFSIKLSTRYYFDPICIRCAVKEHCHEGFYGVRVEKRDGYWVRLCIYKQTHDVLMPWRIFLESGLPEKIRRLCVEELS